MLVMKSHWVVVNSFLGETLNTSKFTPGRILYITTTETDTNSPYRMVIDTCEDIGNNKLKISFKPGILFSITDYDQIKLSPTLATTSPAKFYQNNNWHNFDQIINVDEMIKDIPQYDIVYSVDDMVTLLNSQFSIMSKHFDQIRASSDRMFHSAIETRIDYIEFNTIELQ
jgi:hypothetical protein